MPGAETNAGAIGERVATAPLFGGGWGSLQLALRHEALTFGQLGLSTAPIVPHRATSIPGSQEMATTGGLTWYANRWTRIQINVVRERLRGLSLALRRFWRYSIHSDWH